MGKLMLNGVNYSSKISKLEELEDININTPSNGQVLKYNSTNQKWENGTGGGGSAITITPIVTSGVKIATITIDGVDYDLYAPQGGGPVLTAINAYESFASPEQFFMGLEGVEINDNN